MASKKNIYTGIVCALAVALAAAAVLIKIGAFRPKPGETTRLETIEETAVVLASKTNAEGDIAYYTMLTRYVRPKVSSHHVYPSKKTSATAASEPSSVERSVVYVQATDENGEPLFDENGEPITEILEYTVSESESSEPSTEYVPKTSIVELTDKVLHKPLKDIRNGKPLTTIIFLEPPPTAPEDIWSQNVPSATTNGFGVDINIAPELKRDDNLERAILNQLNADREKRGLAPLKSAADLKASARTNGVARALPDVSGYGALIENAYNFETDYGGLELYKKIFDAVKDEAESEETREVGIGVIKYKDVYYTTVIFRR